MKLIFYILLFNSFSALTESQRIKEREQINQVLINADKKLRLNFTSDENFKQFKFLKSDDSTDNVDLITKFLDTAIKSFTITQKELDIFYKYIGRISECSLLQLKIMKYQIAERSRETDLNHSKFIEETAIFKEKMAELYELEKLEKEKEKEKNIYYIGSFLISYYLLIYIF